MTLGNIRDFGASGAAANKRKKPLGIGRAARCQELPGLTRFRSPLNNALLPVMFRAARAVSVEGRPLPANSLVAQESPHRGFEIRWLLGGSGAAFRAASAASSRLCCRAPRHTSATHATMIETTTAGMRVSRRLRPISSDSAITTRAVEAINHKALNLMSSSHRLFFVVGFPHARRADA
jgi:hypothetical protein